MSFNFEYYLCRVCDYRIVRHVTKSYKREIYFFIVDSDSFCFIIPENENMLNWVVPRGLSFTLKRLEMRLINGIM